MPTPHVTSIPVSSVARTPTVCWDGLEGASLDRTQFDRHLLDNLNPKTFERGYPLRTIGQQADAPQVQIRQNLRSDPDLALNLLLLIDTAKEASGRGGS